MMRSIVHLVLLLSLLAVHGAGLVRFIDGAVLCIDEAGMAVEGADETGQCECDGETESTADRIELIAPDCVDVTLAFSGNLQLTAGDFGPKLTAITLAPCFIPVAIIDECFADRLRVLAARVRATAAPPEYAPLAQLRTVILRT